MSGLDMCNMTNQSDQLLSSPSSQSARSRVKYNESADLASSRKGSSGVTTDAANEHSNGVRKFTSKELSQLNQQHNAHVAYRGKVPMCENYDVVIVCRGQSTLIL